MLTRRSLLAASAAAPALSYVGGESAEAATPKDVVVMGKTIDDMIALDPAQAYRVHRQRAGREHLPQAGDAGPEDRHDGDR